MVEKFKVVKNDTQSLQFKLFLKFIFFWILFFVIESFISQGESSYFIQIMIFFFYLVTSYVNVPNRYVRILINNLTEETAMILKPGNYLFIFLRIRYKVSGLMILNHTDGEEVYLEEVDNDENRVNVNFDQGKSFTYLSIDKKTWIIKDYIVPWLRTKNLGRTLFCLLVSIIVAGSAVFVKNEVFYSGNYGGYFADYFTKKPKTVEPIKKADVDKNQNNTSTLPAYSKPNDAEAQSAYQRSINESNYNAYIQQRRKDDLERERLAEIDRKNAEIKAKEEMLERQNQEMLEKQRQLDENNRKQNQEALEKQNQFENNRQNQVTNNSLRTENSPGDHFKIYSPDMSQVFYARDVNEIYKVLGARGWMALIQQENGYFWIGMADGTLLRFSTIEDLRQYVIDHNLLYTIKTVARQN